MRVGSGPFLQLGLVRRDLVGVLQLPVQQPQIWLHHGGLLIGYQRGAQTCQGSELRFYGGAKGTRTPAMTWTNAV